MTASFQIGGKWVGAGHPVFVIAEAGVNHNGSAALARELIDAAAGCGADAVKFQTFAADRLVTPASPKAAYQQQSGSKGESQFDMLKRLELSADVHRDLVAYASARGIVFLSTPFDAASADLLDELGVPAFKTGSGELTDLPLLAHVARKRRPMIVSTGMSWLGEVERAVGVVCDAGEERIALLHCVSSYPAAPEDCNLRALDTLRLAFGVPVGYSDHTLGQEIAIAAVARGACIIEKHFTLGRSLPGPDHQASIEPPQFAELTKAIRNIESALGDGRKKPAGPEIAMRAVARKSVVALVDIPAGRPLTPGMLGIRRPGSGIPPAEMERVIGRTCRLDVKAGSPLVWEHLS